MRGHEHMHVTFVIFEVSLGDFTFENDMFEDSEDLQTKFDSQHAKIVTRRQFQSFQANICSDDL